MRASKPHYIIDTERIMWKNSTTGVTPYGNCSKECDAGGLYSGLRTEKSVVFTLLLEMQQVSKEQYRA